MKFEIRGASRAALLLGMAAVAAAPGWAQQAPATVPAGVDQTAPAAAPQAEAPDRVIVTGQLIAGASEDAPSPVESFSLDDLKQQGSPTAAQFLRNLTVSSESFGEADSAVVGVAAGFANVNLRGLGASRTMVLLNGRRFQASDGGNGADINTIPMMAVGNIDVLKDGASVTYGAGAVGGVINYVTRKNFEGFEVNASKKMFDGSQGEDSIEALWGLKSETSNILLGASWGKRHPLAQSKRDFSTLPYQQQPAGWTTTASNPATYYLPNATFTNFTAIRDFTPASCRAIGGEITNTLNNNIALTAFNGPDCALFVAPNYNLIDEENYARGYFEYNSDFSDTMSVHMSVNYAHTTDPNIKSSPSLPGGTTRAIDAGRTSAFGSLTPFFQVPYAVPVYSSAGVQTGTTLNPNAVEFFTRAAAAGVYTGAPGTLDTSVGWRPVLFGGNPMYSDGFRRESQDREVFGGTLSINGDFSADGPLGLGKFLPEGTTYEYSATYQAYENVVSRPDYVVSRLQNALRGYGGPDCKALDRVATNYTSSAAYDASVGIQSDTAPGTNGCQFFNPFASSFQTSVQSGTANPSYGGASFQNSAALMDWFTADRAYETRNNALTIDALYTGKVPGFELPGGRIGWAVGAQWRQTETRTKVNGTEDEVQEAGLDCPWGDQGLPESTPGQYQCTAKLGPFFSSGLPRLFSTQSDRQTLSGFFELQLPILDNFNVQFAARHEDFGDFKGDIWKVAGKYDILPDLFVRASYSTNFQAPPEDINTTGLQSGATYIGSLFRSIPTNITTVQGITPEDDTGSNIGIVYQPEVLGGRLRMSADFFEFTIDKEIGTASLTRVFENVFGVTTLGATTAANCASPFVKFVNFVSGSCVQGTSNVGNIQSFNTYVTNLGGYINNGVDYNVSYTHDLGPGEITGTFNATQTLVYKVKGYGIPGVLDSYAYSYDALGFANLSRNGTIMPEWRANASLNYRFDDFNFTLRANYIKGVTDEKYIQSNPTRPGYGHRLDGTSEVINGQTISYAFPSDQITGRNADGTPILATYGTTPDDYVDFDFTMVYSPVWLGEGSNLRFSILNLTDEDPMEAQNTNAAGSEQLTRTGYYPGYGNPRGRQIEIGITKKF